MAACGHPPSGRGLSDQTRAEPLIELGSTRWSPMPRFPGWICRPCKTVLFSYSDPETALTPDKATP